MTRGYVVKGVRIVWAAGSQYARADIQILAVRLGREVAIVVETTSNTMVIVLVMLMVIVMLLMVVVVAVNI